jgi:hypothetical protein
LEHRGPGPLRQPPPGDDCRSVAGLPRLEHLSLASPALRSLAGLGAVPTLKFLGLYNAKKLASLDGIDAAGGLTEFEVNDCKKIGRIDPVASLVHLVSVQLCEDGQIQSLKRHYSHRLADFEPQRA